MTTIRQMFPNLASMTDAELDAAADDWYAWVDGDPENGPRNPDRDDVAYIKSIEDEQMRRAERRGGN